MPRKRVPDSLDLRSLAARARYVGSPEHKTLPGPWGGPRPRPDASRYPTGIGIDEARTWLREAIEAGRVAGPLEGGFPRYVYHRHSDTWFEARLTNRDRGLYKGYPVETDCVPAWLQR